jgi:hypothetical protein
MAGENTDAEYKGESASGDLGRCCSWTVNGWVSDFGADDLDRPVVELESVGRGQWRPDRGPVFSCNV